MSVALVIDSNSQLPPELAERYGVTIVPIHVSVNGEQFLEGIDIDADAFYKFFEGGETPEVKTSQPSPGAFAEVYRELEADGHEAVLSVHVAAAFSGTLNSARLGAETVDIPVRLVDSRTLSFGVSCCLWEAAELLRDGADVEVAAGAAERVADVVRSVTIIQALDFALAGGRTLGYLPEDKADIDVLRTGPDGSFDVVGSRRTIDELCDLMAQTMHSDGAPIRAAVCIADASAGPFWEGLEARLEQRDDVVDLVRYRVGPSVGAFTGPGAAGGFWYPVGA